MTTFTEALIQIVPDIRTDGAAAVRSCLIGLGRQLQEDPDSQTHSLQTWWQWLDDEGYDSETFATILSQICKVRIGEQSLNELTSYIKSSKDNSDGITMLLEQVKQSHPSFAEEVEILESLALEEENQLGATAGGLSKGGKWGVGAGVGIVGIAGIITTVLILKSKKNAKRTIEREVTERAETREESFDITLRSESTEVYHHVAEDPQKIIDSLKSNESQPRERYAITQFSDKDLSDEAETYVNAHSKKFERDVEKLAKEEIESNYLSDEELWGRDMEKYLEANGGSEEKRLKEIYGNIRTFTSGGREKDIKKFKESLEYENAVSRWGRSQYGARIRNEVRRTYEESTKSIQQAYKDLLRIEKAYKENGGLHALSKEISKAEGFANKDVDEAIEEIDKFGTKLSIDVENRAKEALEEYEEAVKEFARREELEAAQLAKDGAEKMEATAIKTEEAAERAAKEDILV